MGERELTTRELARRVVQADHPNAGRLSLELLVHNFIAGLVAEGGWSRERLVEPEGGQLSETGWDLHEILMRALR